MLVYHELKVCASGLVILDVLCPRLTRDLDNSPDLRAPELDEHQRLTISLLVAVWEVVVGKSVGREEFDIAHEITICWVLKTRNKNISRAYQDKLHIFLHRVARALMLAETGRVYQQKTSVPL